MALRLLGGFEVRVGGERLEGLRSSRARELLAYLALHPAIEHGRQRLAFSFWPDSSEEQARTNLRNALHLLRRAHPLLDASLLVTSTTLRWRPAGEVTVDVTDFVVAADAVAAADADDVDGSIDRCRTAVELYAGDLLDGHHGEWLVPLRDRLRDRYRGVLATLVTALIDDGRAGEATGFARDLVRGDPLDEAAHRLRIEAHARAGDRAGAVRAYHECVATLEREVGVGASPATVALYTSFVGDPGEVGASSRDPSIGRRHRLVGRAGEWRQLVAAWEAARSGPPTAVLVTGEAGIGKTRLVDEFSEWCAASGAAIGTARSYANEGDLGLAVVVSWLRSADIASWRTRLSTGEHGELARLLPELGVPPPIDGADEATRRRRLFDAVVAALTASNRPTLLIADDSQWSDRASHELIHYLIRERRRGRLLVVLTARDDEVDATHPLRALHDGLSVLDRLTEVRLQRLPVEATGELGSQLIGSTLSESSVEALFNESKGNPLFVVEAIRGGWDGRGGQAGLTPRLRAVIDARFRQLSEPAVAVLRSAAVVGRPSSAALLRMVSGLDERTLVRGLDELWQRGILRETGADSYELSHARLRDAAYDGLAPGSRRTWHALVADALIQLGERETGSATSSVALHLEAANRREEAVTWLHRAAIEAQLVFAYSEAVHLLERALALVPSLPSDVRHARELELLSALPGALAGVDGYGTTRMTDAHRRAADVAAGLGVELDPAFVRSTVMSALCRDEFAAAGSSAARLAAQAAMRGDVALAIESHYLSGISAFWSADLDAARRHFDTVVSDFEPSMRRRHQGLYGHDPQVVCLSRLANTLWFIGRGDEARATCEAALTMAADVAHPLSHDTAAIFACLLAVDLEDHDVLRRYAPRLGHFGMDSVPHVTKHEALLGLIDVLDGRTSDGISRVRAALDRCGGRNFYPGFQGTIVRILLAAHAAAPDAVGGLRTVERALSMGGTPLWHAEAHRLRAEFLWQTGANETDVVAALDRAERVARAQGAVGHLRRVSGSRRRLLGSRPRNGDIGPAQPANASRNGAETGDVA